MSWCTNAGTSGARRTCGRTFTCDSLGHAEGFGTVKLCEV